MSEQLVNKAFPMSILTGELRDQIVAINHCVSIERDTRKRELLTGAASLLAEIERQCKKA